MDKIQYGTERDLAIRNVDRRSNLLPQAKARRSGLETAPSESVWSVNARSAQNVWRPYHGRHCIRCQDAADRDRHDGTGTLGDGLVYAA